MRFPSLRFLIQRQYGNRVLFMLERIMDLQSPASFALPMAEASSELAEAFSWMLKGWLCQFMGNGARCLAQEVTRGLLACRAVVMPLLPCFGQLRPC